MLDYLTRSTVWRRRAAPSLMATSLLATTLLVITLLIAVLVMSVFVTRQLGTTQDDDPILDTNVTVSQPLDQTNASPVTAKAIEFDHSTRTLDVLAVNRNFREQLHKPYGFVSDTLRNKLLWTSSADQHFKRANLDGTNVEIIPTNFDNPYSIERVMPMGRQVFYLGNGAIRKKVIDHQIGEESDLIVLKINPQRHHGLGLDEALKTLYLGDHIGQPSIEIVLDSDLNKPISIRRLVAN